MIIIIYFVFYQKYSLIGTECNNFPVLQDSSKLFVYISQDWPPCMTIINIIHVGLQKAHKDSDHNIVVQ